MIASLFYGFSLPLRAASLVLTRPRLILWSAFPVAITIALYVYALAGIRAWMQAHVLAWLTGVGLDPNGWAALGVLALTHVVLFVIGGATFSSVAVLLSSPFNDFLAESAEPYAVPPLPPAAPATWRSRARLIAIDMAKTAAALTMAILTLLVSWVPFLDVVALTMTFLLLTFQFISYPQTRRGVRLGAGLKFLFRHFFACAGFGATLAILFAIPFISCFFLPLAVVGGTLLVARAPGSAALTPLR